MSLSIYFTVPKSKNVAYKYLLSVCYYIFTMIPHITFYFVLFHILLIKTSQFFILEKINQLEFELKLPPDCCNSRKKPGGCDPAGGRPQNIITTCNFLI